ncbi:hypothetical protein SAMN05216345_11558 [Cupriavidus sp. YR651]|uniref:flagellar biosynthesis sigma factor n=1 Tax=Cupriavidus sp. YR651 TaxID=1855315 RepID=UPI000891FE35|nr:flagellar biosynthesis sigma factor [Cupriavidus sp. YR651]SDD76137.1 hypothetical protein SAMN05216345_11558 [Cupriavidus sp. YR651]
MRSPRVRRHGYIAAAILVCGVLGAYAALRPTDKVLLTIGEPYEQVRKQSESTLPPAEPGANWVGVLSRPATLHLLDPKYGFTTPPAKYFVVHYDSGGMVEGVELSPQLETLPLDETMAVLVGLQDQLRRGGWRQIRAKDSPAITDTPAMRAQMRSNDAPQSFWIAGDKYQVSLGVRRFVHENRPADERYLITLQVSGPPFIEDGPAD